MKASELAMIEASGVEWPLGWHRLGELMRHFYAYVPTPNPSGQLIAEASAAQAGPATAVDGTEASGPVGLGPVHLITAAQPVFGGHVFYSKDRTIFAGDAEAFARMRAALDE